MSRKFLCVLNKRTLEQYLYGTSAYRVEAPDAAKAVRTIIVGVGDTPIEVVGKGTGLTLFSIGSDGARALIIEPAKVLTSLEQ